ncbi:RNA 2',3'-cyclic phosphodiesterase [Pontibacter fetidus]|uniref:RNA 2',3'-cyclic phosphodiesterase n=1 Tax=Pontibacter fetidus TaxID=2700082 RepID=A0A6B2GXN6_9BACT|nr:RNA 2',3'-cyclic phosphodiesterase [Pontibacter fetidus]NDK54618.1 RNA 2',3'-cyclic phosphodiesterase [Pontibacter fetidus]
MDATLRLFVAAGLTDELGPYLKEQMRPLLDDTLRPVPLQNMHLTLFFIGNVPVAALDEIRVKVKTIAQQCEPFTLQLTAVEQGPKPKSPRLIWARFEEHPAFAKLSRKLSEALAPDEPNKLKPTPHITLARYRKNIGRPATTPAILPETTITLPVHTIGIWKSELASPHPVYSIIESYLLGQNQSPA